MSETTLNELERLLGELLQVVAKLKAEKAKAPVTPKVADEPDVPPGPP